MNLPIATELLEPVPDEIARVVSEGIARANRLASVRREDFAVVHRLGSDLVGAVTASVSFSVLFVNNLWVAEEKRRSGLGRGLMLAVESEARRRGAETACVDTLSSQAPGFYARLGYEEFGRIRGRADGHELDRIWFRKPL